MLNGMPGLISKKNRQRKYRESLPEEKRKAERDKNTAQRKKARDALSEEKKTIIRKKDNETKKEELNRNKSFYALLSNIG